LKNQNLENSTVLISNVDCQASMAGGVIIQILGELISEQQCFKFSQTFFLAQQPEGYYVLNDIFRFLKEDVVEFQGKNIYIACFLKFLYVSPSFSSNFLIR
jgi:Nuclear transport factor 2 (NTF2) domain